MYFEFYFAKLGIIIGENRTFYVNLCKMKEVFIAQF